MSGVMNHSAGGRETSIKIDRVHRSSVRVRHAKSHDRVLIDVCLCVCRGKIKKITRLVFDKRRTSGVEE